MFTNKPEFRVKEVIQLSKLSSEVLNNLLADSEVYLSKRILTYVLAQQISIQIASDRDLVHLRGYAAELEDYTLLQLLNFTDSQGIEVDTFDIKFRLWTVVFNNLRELTIKDTAIQRALADTEERFEYAKDVFSKLTRFIDETNDIDGQPFIIAKESLSRFSTREEVEAFGLSIGVKLPQMRDKESTVNFIMKGLEDTNPELRDELMNMNMQDIEEYARVNFIADDLKMSKKEMINRILDSYSPEEHHIRNIEYQKHLEIPSLYNYQVEDDANEENLKPGQLFDEELKEMIAKIVHGEDHKQQDTITEEKSKEELDSIMSKIVRSYEPPRRENEEVLLKKIDDLEKRLAERQSYDPNMLAMMNKISHMETQLLQPKTSTDRDDLLLKKIEEIEKKIQMLARGENPELTESQKIEQLLLTKLAELEEKISYMRVGDVKSAVEEVTQTVENSKVNDSVEIQEDPVFEVESDPDYEYDMDHFVPRPVVIPNEKEESEENDAQEEIQEVVEEPKGPSETELILLKRLEEIEQKLESRDNEIEELKREVESKKNEADQLRELESVHQKEVDELKETIHVMEEEKVQPFIAVAPLEEAEEETIEETEVDKIEESTEDVSEDKTEENEEAVEEESINQEVVEESEETIEEADETEETLEEIMDDIAEMEEESTVEDIHTDLEADSVEEDEKSDFDKFIEEIHSSKDKNKIKVRRRHTVQFVQVFWKAAAIWVMLAAIGAIILMVYNSL